MKKAILILLVINLGICFVIAQPYFSKTYRFTENSSIADQIFIIVNTIAADLPHFDIHPNPITDLININPANEKEYSLTIYNVTGKLLYSRQNLKNEHVVNARRFGKGIYFLKLSQVGKVISRKLVKQ